MNKSRFFEEIERKFLPKAIPFDLTQLARKDCERIYLYMDSHSELRVQHKGANYELEHKSRSERSDLIRTTVKVKVSQEDWEELKTKKLGNEIIFDKYQCPSPGMFIKEYQGSLKGLLVLEIEFKSLEEANSFQVEGWMGQEVSSLSFSRDSGLIHYSSFEEIKEELLTR